ncbi:MAG: hypothetical protein ACI8RY_001009 [Urechidicola sp.]|jgi:hypothetical protein|tara:strand:+ start:144 stop:692 length:549 start_codon:yes stop_codon:yes gene_type:complete
MKTTLLNFTKLFTALFLISLGFFSCNKDLSINFNTNLNQKKSIHIDQTAGTAVTFTESSTIELENDDTREYLDRIDAIESINSFTYQFQDFTGDAAGTVSFDIIVNGTVIEHQDNIIIKNESDSATLFQISDEAMLTKIANGLLNDQEVTFEFSGTAQCDAAPMDFDMEIKMNIAVSANPLN